MMVMREVLASAPRARLISDITAQLGHLTRRSCGSYLNAMHLHLMTMMMMMMMTII